jgi:hypothetical protein
MMTAVIPFAHAGHWIASLAYLAPVALVGAVMAVQSRRHRGEPDASRPDAMH